jgi:hypothetical protein
VEGCRVIDDRANRIARRVAIHQAVDEIVDGRRRVFGDETGVALSDALRHLSTVALDGPVAPEKAWQAAWQAVAAIAQGQLEQAMEERAS